MDALDIMSNLDAVMPYYQAIFSADEHRIIGYEVLGRILFEDEMKSLGPFFEDESVPEEFRIEIDDIVLRKALDYSVSKNNDYLLFINRDPNLLMLDHGESFLLTLHSYVEKGLQLHNVVIELSEHNYHGDIEQLNHLLTYYRTYGLKIAVDNIGKESSNLDRIGILSPDILKIDLAALRNTNTTQAYSDVLYSISLLARKIGATLLYEDIETLFQLQYAWKNGGRYYQGYYLQKPSRDYLDENILKDRLKKEIHQFIQYEKKKLQDFYGIIEQFQLSLQTLVSKHKNLEDYNELLRLIAIELHEKCFRLYICDEDGFQQSANFSKVNNEWVLDKRYLLKNWSWRPYFLENIIRMRQNRKGIMSDLYSDIETSETIRTFSYPIFNNLYLFIDIPYSFLYEQEGLL